MQIRLNKYLSECGIASRRKVEEFILQGRISVNGEIVDHLAVKVDPDKDKIMLDNETVRQSAKVYYLLNKPKGFITTTNDEKQRKTVMDLIKTKVKIFPVGRLDYDTTGVLILTNDGDFTNLLLHPENKVPRIYRVTLNRPLHPKDKEKLLKGIMVEYKKGRFDSVYPTKKAEVVNISTVEGRNHFVKNMFKALGYRVTDLSRIMYGGIKVDNLPVGAYRNLSAEEINTIVKKYAR
ncbi:MAG: pseudouridine synthase [Syntrophothermus sp.]